MMKIEKKENKFSDVSVRSKSWIPIIAVFTIMIATTISMDVVLSLLITYALVEYSIMVGLSCKVYRYLYYSFSVLIVIVFYKNDYILFVLLNICCVLVLLLSNIFFVKQKGANRRLILGVFICILCLGHFSFIRHIESPNLSYAGVKLTLFVFALTELNDVFQYYSGKFFGKTKIVPRISPNKTVEGFIGGVILTTILATIYGIFLLPPGNIFIGTTFGFFIAIFGFCGDIFMSSIKRRANVKDTGTLIPGHGGLLDRVDSLLFVLPLFYWSFILIYGT